MKKSLVLAAMVFAMLSSSAAMALPIYDGKTSPRGAQIFVLSRTGGVSGETGYHVAGPMETHWRRQDARHRRALELAEERLARREALTPSEARAIEAARPEPVLRDEPVVKAPAVVLEQLDKPNPVVNGTKMGRFVSPETLQQPAAAAKNKRHMKELETFLRERRQRLTAQVKTPAPAKNVPATAGLQQVVVDPRDIPVFKAGRVSLPKGWFNAGLKESPFTITELVRLARRRCLGMSLDGDVLNLAPMGNQPIWLVLEPAAIDRGEIWIPKSSTPVKYVEFETGENPSRVRITGGYLVLRPGIIESVVATDKVGRGSKSDPVYAQAEAVMALRKAAGDQRQWGRVLAGVGIALANGQIVKAVTGNSDGFTVQAGLDFPKWEFFRSVSGSNY